MIGRIVEGDVGKNVESESRIARRQEFGRKVFLQIHLTVGLFAGAIFVLVGLSGSILAFREDIDELLNASIMRVETPAQRNYRPLNEILAAAVAGMPPGGKLERLTMPRHSGAAAAITYKVETDDLDSFFYEMFIDPYTAKVKGQRVSLHGDDTFSQPLIQIIMAFHWTLLLGANNAYMLGAVGILIFISVLVGLYLWWPVNGNWRLGLKVKWGASPERSPQCAPTRISADRRPFRAARQLPSARPPRSRITSSPMEGFTGFCCLARRVASMSSESRRMTNPIEPKRSEMSASTNTAAKSCMCKIAILSPQAKRFWSGCTRYIPAKFLAKSAVRSLF